MMLDSCPSNMLTGHCGLCILYKSECLVFANGGKRVDDAPSKWVVVFGSF